jgi:hypothetical protein
MRVSRRNLWSFSKAVGVIVVAGAVAVAAAYAAASPPMLQGTFRSIASTVKKGDVNPYGMAFVGGSSGRLVRGDILVSNFNNSKNLQGVGSTIVEVSPTGSRTLFAAIDARTLPGACSGGVGLTTALVELSPGWVIVGSLPTSNGKSPTAKAGCLLVLNSAGTVVETWSGHGLNGPWDMTASQSGSSAALYVTNVLNGTVAAKGARVHRGSVLRLNVSLPAGKAPLLQRATVVGSGFPERTDPGALVVGPTGVGLGTAGRLYVADTLDNRIDMISHANTRTTSAGKGTVVTSGGVLNNPLGLLVAPNGAVLTVNAGDGKLAVTDPTGKQVGFALLDSSGKPKGSGALFGLALTKNGGRLFFVDDATNKLDSFTSPQLGSLVR